MSSKRSKGNLKFEDISNILNERAKNESYYTTLLQLAQANNWTKSAYEQNYETLSNLCQLIQKENELLFKLNQINHPHLIKPEVSSIKNLKQVLGIDLGTSKSTVGVYKINSRGRVDIDIVSNKQGERSNPSVICLYKDKMYFGKDAIKVSVKCPQNLIYDTKRMLGRKFDDPFIQKMRKYWTFQTVKSKNGGILIEVDGYQYEPYEISGMILNYLMILANSHLREPTNYAIITIPEYFTEEQKEDTRKAAKAAGLRLLELIEEPKAAAFCYGYKSNDTKNEQKERDIFIYDIGGGTLDVSYVEVKGSSFKILAAAGDPFLGGQDFTNCIFEYISTFINKLCHETWKNEPRFVSYIKDECEKAKQYLADSEDCDIFIDIPTKLQKTEEITLEINLTRKQFEKISHNLFERCMDPVKDVLRRVQRDPKQISGLVLIGGSSFLPKIRNQLKEITGQNAYHGVSPIEAVVFGACATSVKYCEDSLAEFENSSSDINNRFLTHFSVKEVAPATIEIQKIKDKVKYYFTMIEEGTPLPFSKETLIYSNDIEYQKNAKEIIIPVFVKKGENRILLGNIVHVINQKKYYQTNIPLVKIKLRQITSKLFYSTNDPSTECWSSETPVEHIKVIEHSPTNENQIFNKTIYPRNNQTSSQSQDKNFQLQPPVTPETNFRPQPLVVQNQNIQKQSPAVQEIQVVQQQSNQQNITFQREVQVAQDKRIQKQSTFTQETSILKTNQAKENVLQKQIIMPQKIQNTNHQAARIQIGFQNQVIVNQNHDIYNQNYNGVQQQFPSVCQKVQNPNPITCINQHSAYHPTFVPMQQKIQNSDHMSVSPNLQNFDQPYVYNE